MALNHSVNLVSILHQIQYAHIFQWALAWKRISQALILWFLGPIGNVTTIRRSFPYSCPNRNRLNS